MGAEMTGPWPERALGRILDALEREIIAMPDKEIATILAEPGIWPAVPGSTLWAGLRYAALRPTICGREEPEEERGTDERKNAATSRTRPSMRR
jgi:hypothetical protein